jgi:signal transduction histidine kinase
VRLAGNVADYAGLLLHNQEVFDGLAEQLRVKETQEAELAASRRRLEVAKHAARERLSAEIGARVGAPLERCGQHAEAAVAGLGAAGAGTEDATALAAGLAAMTGEIDTAIAAFRLLVHRVHPPVLTDHGLRAALESLLSSTGSRASLLSPPVPRLSNRVEQALYFCAADLLEEWDDAGAQRPMRIFIGPTATKIQVTVEDDVAAGGEWPALPVSPSVFEGVVDRAVALGGHVHAEGDEAGRRLTVELPLTSADLVAQNTRIRR